MTRAPGVRVRGTLQMDDNWMQSTRRAFGDFGLEKSRPKEMLFDQEWIAATDHISKNFFTSRRAFGDFGLEKSRPKGDGSCLTFRRRFQEARPILLSPRHRLAAPRQSHRRIFQGLALYIKRSEKRRGKTWSAETGMVQPRFTVTPLDQERLVITQDSKVDNCGWTSDTATHSKIRENEGVRSVDVDTQGQANRSAWCSTPNNDYERIIRPVTVAGSQRDRKTQEANRYYGCLDAIEAINIAVNAK
ncbi:hypothetical protein LXA43DRAFT_1087783 [Ganoderma leucocontextum]|nr:hypothetical protein LXA43DRAFT_1087783 [Ganoderma leucocontextum]